jgi:phospholipase A-2-activating protein
MSGHSNFISSVCYMPPDETYPQGLILTGSNDSTILAFTLNSPAPIYKLEGHTENGKYLSKSSFTCPGLRASGLARRLIMSLQFN